MSVKSNPIPDEFRTAFEETDLLIIRMGGCVDALVALAKDYDGLNCPDRQANSIVSLIHVVEDGLARLGDLHSAEWNAVRQRGEAA